MGIETALLVEIGKIAQDRTALFIRRKAVFAKSFAGAVVPGSDFLRYWGGFQQDITLGATGDAF
jgi:hypothetical protein